MSDTWHGRRKREQRGRKWTGGHGSCEFGHEFEKRIAHVLSVMAQERLIDSFVYHPHAPKKDFTIVRGDITREVNVTTSQRAWKDHYEKFGQEVEIVYFHYSATDEEISGRILELFC